MATINIRIKDEDKIAVENILGEIGLSLTSATTAFYKQIIMQRKIPFELKASNSNDEILELIRRKNDIENNNVVKSIAELEALNA